MATTGSESSGALPDSALWAGVSAHVEHLRRVKKQGAAQGTISRIVSAIALLARSDIPITAAAVGRMCVERWGGPRAQSIANDPAGYAELVRLARAAQSLPPRQRPADAGADLLSRIADPTARAEVHLLLAEAASLRGQIANLRQAIRRLTPLGPITSALAAARVDSLEQLADRLEQAARPQGLAFDAEERAAVSAFLAGLHNEGMKIDGNTGELLARSGRRMAKSAFVRALRKIVGTPEDGPSVTASRSTVDVTPTR